MTQAPSEIMREFHSELEDANILPLWDRYHDVLPLEPTAPDRPMRWRWTDLLPFVDRAERDVSMEDAVRRVLMLINPAFDGKPYTTTNLFAGMQILGAGERAPAHRHTPSAMRFIIEGGGATIVNSQHCPMEPGDLILTPNWAWHEHVNDTDHRVVWLDALDLPLTANLGTLFSQHGGTNEFADDISALPDAAFAGAGLVPQIEAAPVSYSPMFRYPWTRTLPALDAAPAAPDGSRRVRYTNPVDGGPAITTMDCYAWRINKGAPTETRRTSANAVFLVVDGEGTSRIGDDTIEWRQHDVFTTPHWNWTSHEAASDNAHLFYFTDREVLRRLNFLREETQD